MIKFREKKKPLLVQELGHMAMHVRDIQKYSSIVIAPFQRKGVMIGCFKEQNTGIVWECQ